ncbi:MAG TPA: hypothetical protein VFZ53_02355 [Polyangiaceae bacterium]
MFPADRRVIALGNLVGELKSSLEEATRSSGIELVLTREPAKALVELERASAVAVLVDMATLGAEQFCKRARGTERLRGVPIIGMSRTPSELGFARVFAWGADDLVPLGATPALARRLSALLTTAPADQTNFGQAVVAEGTTQRRALLGRVLVHAGYDVKFAVDRGSVELYASQAETRIVVISATLGDPRKLIESASKAGGLATWIVTAEERSVSRLATSLAGLGRVVVTSTAGSPEDILFLANEIVFGKGNRPREWRALYGTPVAFRPLGATTDDYGFSYDVSPGGLYVRSLLPCESDDVEVELRPPERDERVRLLGKVVRRFAFGSGSVASAPPGFGVKVTGPSSPALTLWIEACRAHVEQAGSGSPPDARTPTGAPDKKSSESSMPALAVPGPNLTIESVVLPLPSERTDVAGLLSETLGEEAPPEAGTRPVTVDAETGGVREERPSEYGLGLEGTEASLAPPPDKTPEPPANRPPSRPPLPMPVAPQRDEHDDTTTVYERSEVEAFAQQRDQEAARLLTPFPLADSEAVTVPPLDAITVPPASMSDAVTAPPRPPTIADDGPPLMFPPEGPPPVIAEAPDAPPAPRPPPVAPVTTPAAFAGTVALPPRPQATGLGGTLVMSPPVPPRVLEPPAKSSPAATPFSAPVAGPPPPPSARFAASPPAPVVGPPPELAAPSSPPPAVMNPATVDPPEPAAPVAVAEPPAPAPFSPYGGPSVHETSRGFPMQAPPPAESLPRPVRPADVHPEVPVPSEPLGKQKKGGGSGLLLALVGFVALAAGVGGGVFLLTRSNAPEKPPEPAPAPQVVEPAPGNVEPSAAPPPSAEAPASAPADSLPKPVPEPSASVAPPAETAAPTPPAAVPPPAFDLEKLPGDRAALLVRSSASARVFVHGKDYGETNQYLLTSCGIRFVRLGRGFNEFLEPGRSVVVKCGRVTELTIEPDR